MARKGPSLKSIKGDISHLRAMIRRIEAMKLQAPKGNIPTVRVVQSGSRLKIDGKTYTPAQLKAMKGKTADWQISTLAQLRRKLSEKEYQALRHEDVRKGNRRLDKITRLTPLEIEQAEAGLDYLTSAEEQEFHDWLNCGSRGIKHWYYHQAYGARTVNAGDIRNFLEYMEMETGKEIKEVKDLYGIFRDS